MRGFQGLRDVGVRRKEGRVDVVRGYQGLKDVGVWRKEGREGGCCEGVSGVERCWSEEEGREGG